MKICYFNQFCCLRSENGFTKIRTQNVIKLEVNYDGSMRNVFVRNKSKNTNIDAMNNEKQLEAKVTSIIDDYKD